MCQGGVGYFFTTEHARNFLHTCIGINHCNLTGSAFCIALFGHHQMMIGTRRHLRQMGHRQHLAVDAKLLHQAPDGFGHGAAHARIDFVKNQGLRGAQLAGGHSNGQSNA